MPCEISYSVKKGLKGFLLVEFRKGALLVRLRFKVVLTSSGYWIQIRESKSQWIGDSRLRQSRIEVGDHVSERQLFEAMAKYISNKEKIPVASVAFRWENGSLGLPKSEVSTF
jgi:hypothetical protein